jgi:hypothetical protein
MVDRAARGTRDLRCLDRQRDGACQPGSIGAAGRPSAPSRCSAVGGIVSPAASSTDGATGPTISASSLWRDSVAASSSARARVGSLPGPGHPSSSSDASISRAAWFSPVDTDRLIRSMDPTSSATTADEVRPRNTSTYRRVRS